MINLIVLVKGRRIRLRREDKEIAKLRLLQLREKYGQHKVFVAYDEPKAPPKDFKRKGLYLWCSYCHKPRVFITCSRSKLNKCPVCEMTENNFYIQKHNKLSRTTRIGATTWDVQQVALKHNRTRKKRG